MIGGLPSGKQVIHLPHLLFRQSQIQAAMQSGYREGAASRISDYRLDNGKQVVRFALFHERIIADLMDLINMINEVPFHFKWVTYQPAAVCLVQHLCNYGNDDLKEPCRPQESQ